MAISTSTMRAGMMMISGFISSWDSARRSMGSPIALVISRRCSGSTPKLPLHRSRCRGHGTACFGVIGGQGFAPWTRERALFNVKDHIQGAVHERREFRSRRRPRSPPGPRRGRSRPIGASIAGGVEDDDDDDDPVVEATTRWLRSVVVELNLCPWAGAALSGGHVKVVVHPRPEEVKETAFMDKLLAGKVDPRGVGPDGRQVSESGDVDHDPRASVIALISATAAEARALSELPAPEASNATTLVVARPPLLEDFQEYLGVVEAVEKVIEASGLQGKVQVATFHPSYRFEGADEDDASNYTNRSPYPILHLLLEAQVASAIESVDDTSRIWRRNIETTRELGAEAMRRAVDKCRTPSTSEG